MEFLPYILWCFPEPSAIAPQSELSSFLVEISAIIMNKPDDQGTGYLVDKIVDKTGAKGTGEWVFE